MVEEKKLSQKCLGGGSLEGCGGAGTIFLACSSQSGVGRVMSNTGTEHCCPSAKHAVQLEKSRCAGLHRMSAVSMVQENGQAGSTEQGMGSLRYGSWKHSYNPSVTFKIGD